jgi:hypothetical protein
MSGGRALTFLLVLSLLGCGRNVTAPPQPPPPERALRLLFIGNSLTSVNDLPGMVTALSKAAGDAHPIETEAVAYSNYALEDHWAQGDAARAIARGGWNAVVLQQGPSSLAASRANLIEYTRRFAPLIRQMGARPALYGVWPEAARLYAFDACIESYRAAADSVDGALYPVALAWKTAWAMDASLPLYGSDQFHPSPLGTYLAALVVYAVVRERSPVGLPSTLIVGGTSVQLDSLQAHTVQLAAEQVSGTGAAR